MTRPMRRAMLVGGAGLIGSTLADTLLRDAQGLDEVLIYDDFSRGTRTNLAMALEDPRTKIVRGDIRDRARLQRYMEGIDVVFHLAAIRITRCAEEPRLANEILVDGAFNVFESAVHCDVDKVILSSSASIYGLAEEFPTTERHHGWNNDTIYGAAKAYNEGVLRSFKAQHDLDYLALRYFNVFGPRMDTVGVYTEVFIRWMQTISEGKSPVIHGDGSATMDFVYVGDIARANLLAAQCSATDQAINIAGSRETSLLQLAEALIEVMGSDVGVEFTEGRKIGGVTRRKADISRAKELLGWAPEIDLHEGLSRLVAWWRANHSAINQEKVTQ